MEFGILAANLGALITTVLGCGGLLVPQRVATFVSIKPIGENGVSEIRATYGGLFLALGLVCLAMQSVSFFTVAGVAWLGAAFGRLFSVLYDKNNDARNFGGLCLEGTVGILLLVPAWKYTLV
jgi:hypothetical protein